MPRFTDEWIIDKTMFDYVQGGSCACCSFANFMPNGTKGLIESMSELETDAANAEVSALDQLPWPPEMKDQVWMERVRVRQFCKKDMKVYRDFWKEHGPDYRRWFLEEATGSQLRRWFQLARSDIVDRLKTNKNFHMHAAFGTVLCAVTEQVAHFEVTKYPTDGRGTAEVGFEEVLSFHRMGGFTLNDIESQDTRTRWLQRHEALGGPRLLERNSKVVDDEDSDDDDGDADDPEPATQQPSKPSFRSDRRIIRLLIARHYADVMQRAFLKTREL